MSFLHVQKARHERQGRDFSDLPRTRTVTESWWSALDLARRTESKQDAITECTQAVRTVPNTDDDGLFMGMGSLARSLGRAVGRAVISEGSALPPGRPSICSSACFPAFPSSLPPSLLPSFRSPERAAAVAEAAATIHILESRHLLQT